MNKLLAAIIILLRIVILSAETESKQGRFFLIPIAGYDNETSVKVGGLVYYAYRPFHRPYNLSPDTHFVNGLISFNKQLELMYRSNFYVRDDLYYISPEIDYEFWPSNFYGIGNNTNKDDAEQYTNNRTSFRFGVIRSVTTDFSAGIFAERDSYRLTDMDRDGSLAGETIPGSERYKLNSLGLSFSYDTRDIALYPTTGMYHKLEVKQSLNLAGNDYSFTQYKLDLRKYFSPDKQNIFAIQTYLSHIDNAAPFQKLDDLGSNMRGYEAKRYIDNSKLLLRGEYRVFPWTQSILSRLGGAVFVETGQVARHIADIRFDQTKVSYGMGLRIALIPSEMLNLRVDFGKGGNYLDIIITTYEAF